MTRTAIAIIAVLALPATQARAQLSQVEQEIVAHIDAHAEEAFALLERSVNINSGTMNLDGVAEVGRLYAAEFEALGMETTWIPMDAVSRSGHLFAETRGGSGKTVLLIGHLDTVFEKDSPFQRYERSDSIAKGPGVADMKGGNLVILMALQALNSVGALENANVIVAFTGDEEHTGDPLEIDRRDLIAAGSRSDVALGFEGNVGGVRKATVARRGFIGWTLEVTGTRAHSSVIFREDLGSGSIYEAARILTAFHEELRGEQYLTFNPGIILGGTAVEYDAPENRGTAFGKTNVIAERTVVAGDLRTISSEQGERAKERMRAIVERNLPHTSATIRFRDSYPSMPPTEGNRAVLAELDRMSRDLGYGPVGEVDPGRRGAADISFVAAHVREGSLSGLGPEGEGSHTVHETLYLNTVPVMAKRAALLVYRLTRE
ncbi:MAG: M20/M25/M40 family metallo-hydrolase [Gemmatimonadota bacterium]